ncbi:hypothetical protein B5F28_08815 [Gemmiger sp. An194]|nr:hypothetical protein B5F28_08815 [Gemmiger sp. An194]
MGRNFRMMEKSIRVIKGKVKKCVFDLITLMCAIQLISFRKRFIIFDTPSHENIGDQAILIAEIEYLKKISPEHKVITIPAECVERFLKTYSNLIKNEDIILIHGGGFLGSIWKDEMYAEVIQRYLSNMVVIFPQTIFYENTHYGNHRLKVEKDIFDKENLMLFVRDQRSQIFAEENLYQINPQNCVLIPDIVLSYHTEISNQSVENYMIACLRNDKEKVSTDNFYAKLEEVAKKECYKLELTDMCTDHSIRRKCEKYRIVECKLKQFAKAKFVVTDRLHCMVFCALVGTPCIAMDNSSKKVKGVYEKWLKDLDYIVFCENENDALSKAKEWTKTDSIKVTRYSPKDLENAFEPLAKVLKVSLMNR